MNKNDYIDTFNFRGKSYNAAMQSFPGARRLELDAILDRLNMKKAAAFCDAPAGGGYLSEGIYEKFGKDVAITCIEPAIEFGSDIQVIANVINTTIDDIPLPDNSFDGLGSLAGLHHILNRAPIFAEWGRLMRPGGVISVADVQVGSPVGKFLNEYVDRYTPQGHDGYFIARNELSDLLSGIGCEQVEESLVPVPWQFAKREHVGSFCKQLFFLENISAEEVTEAVDAYLGISRNDETGGWQMYWELCYASGQMPH